MHQFPEFIQGNSTMKITWILGVLDLNLILQFYKKAHIGAWLFKQRVNSTQKITWIWEIFALWPTFSSFLLFYISTFLLFFFLTFVFFFFNSESKFYREKHVDLKIFPCHCKTWFYNSTRNHTCLLGHQVYSSEKITWFFGFLVF